MTKSKESWVFGMIFLLGASVANAELLSGLIAMILCAVVGTAYLMASVYFCCKGQ